MTALTQFQRLEAEGLWHPAGDGSARPVVVSLGEATITLADPGSDRPLTHWALAAMCRVDAGRGPAVYLPGAPATQTGEADERLEVHDPLMIDAIARVHRAVAARRRRPGRLRGGLMLAGLGLLVVATGLWLPDALVRHAARITPPAEAARIGAALLQDMETRTGPECRRAGGMSVLRHFAPKLLGPDARVAVVPARLGHAIRLPGHLYVIGDDLIGAAAGPEAAAGHLLAAAVAQGDTDVLGQAVGRAGARAALTMLTTGHMPAAALAGQGTAILDAPPPRPAEEALLQRFADVGLSSEPYARSLDPTGETVLGLIEADPFRGAAPPAPLLTETQWLALREICGD